MKARPPSVPDRLLALLLADDDGIAFHGDLTERFKQLAEANGIRTARRWYWWQALSVLTWSVAPNPNSRILRTWGGVLRDLRFGLRTLVRNPIYAGGVTGTVCLGMAAAAIATAIVWPVWLAPVTYPDPDRVVRLYEVEPLIAGRDPTETESRRQQLSPTLLGDLKEHAWSTLEAVSLVTRLEQPWDRDGEVERISSVILSPEGFDILGVVPTLGRLPREPEYERGKEVLLSERFWRTAMGEDPNVIGSKMNLGWGELFVVGVATLHPGYPGDADVVLPIGWRWMIDSEDRAFRHTETIARIRDGRSVSEATAELNSFVEALGDTHIEHRGWSVDVNVLADDLVRPFRPVLTLLLASGLTFLLLAGVNVAGLVVARRAERREDRAIRLALGASEGQLLRASLSEGIVLALVGSIAGSLAAFWLLEPVLRLVPEDIPRLAEVSFTSSLVFTAILVGTMLGAVVGLIAYLASRGGTHPVGRARIWRHLGIGRRGLVVGQVALTTLLTATGAAIFIQLSTLKAIDLGFDPSEVSTTSTTLPDVPGRGPESRWAFAKSILEALDEQRILAAMAFNTPMSGEDLPQVGMRADSASEEIVYDLHLVSPNYFRVMSIELMVGRDFGPEDHASSQRTVIVSEDFVQQYFGSETPVEGAVGKLIAPLVYESERPLVVGVVKSTRHRSPEAPIEPEIYSPLSQLALDAMTLVVRGKPERVAETVPAVAHRADPGARWTPLTPYESRLGQWFAPLRLQVMAIAVLTGLGVLLASLGLYSFMAYQVTAERHDLGVRRALGARDGRLVIGIMGTGMTLTLVGALAGLGAWYQLLPTTSTFLEGIESAGLGVPLVVTLVVGGTCALATLGPALRATQFDLANTLKED